MKKMNELETSVFYSEVKRKHHVINIDVQVLYDENAYILTIVGDVHLGKFHSRGQCQDELKNYIVTSNFPKHIKKLYNQILDIWKEYHLKELKEDKIQELRNICNELNTELKKYMEN